MQWIVIIAVAVISYLIGSVNFSIILSKLISGNDIRESGSGNAGATNMLRTHGKKMALVTLALDIIKGIAAVLIAAAAADMLKGEALSLGVGENGARYIATDYAFLKYLAGLFVILGHDFPLYFSFRGGKGVATSLGVILMLDWKIGIITAAIAIAVMAVTKYVSLGSVIGGMIYMIIGIISALYLKKYGPVELVCIVIIGGLLTAKHHANIKRLIDGTENKLKFGGKA